MRILKTPDNNVIFDDTGRMNGRGAYICPSVECLKKARRTKAIERSLDISIPDEVYDAIEGRCQSLIRDKVLSYIGLAMKSGNVVSGEFAVEKAVKSQKAHVVIVANDASDNTKKKFYDMCSFYEVPVVSYAAKEELGHAIGKDYRAVAAINDAGLAGAVIKNINQEVVDIWQR